MLPTGPRPIAGPGATQRLPPSIARPFH